MDVSDIVAAYLNEHGFDGLYSPDSGCACCLAEDFMPCTDDECRGCEPGYRRPCDCGEHDYHIGAKPAPAEAKA